MDDIYPGFWDLPGGGVKENESLQEAAEREAKEETGLEIKIKKDYFRTKTYSDGEVNYVFVADFVGKNPVVSTEHSEFKWVSDNDWRILEYTPDVKEIIEIFFKNSPF